MRSSDDVRLALGTHGLDRLPIPCDAQAGLLRGHGFARVDTHGLTCDGLELGDVLNPAPIRNGAGQSDVKLHEKARTDHSNANPWT
jgi:hypothetical protein